jgi:hypothetical protein
VEDPIIFWSTEEDRRNLAIIEATGLSREEAMRSAITRMAIECTPVVWALGGSLPPPPAD